MVLVAQEEFTMTIEPTIEHATRPAAGRVSAGYAAKATRYVGAGDGVAGEWAMAVSSSTLAHVAFAGAN